jgi:hypothetical protein
MVMYALLCAVVLGLYRMNAVLARYRGARRDAPRNVVIPAEVALARARRWCSLRDRRAAPWTRRV